MNPTKITRNGKFALIGDHVFTIVQGDLEVFKVMPRPIDMPKPAKDWSVDGIWTIGWPWDELPFMPLVPVHRSFSGPLFRRLSYDDRTIPLQRYARHAWSLDQKVMREWVTLDENLRAVIHAMITLTPGPLHRNFRLWVWPTQYGYEFHYSKRYHARIVALRSRDAFIPMMAAASFGLMLMHEAQARNPAFNWREAVLNLTSIHHQWLADLEASTVGDFSIPRVGGMYDMHQFKFGWLLPSFARMNMPLYLYWGTINNLPLIVVEDVTKLHVVPSRQDVIDLQALAFPSLPPSEVHSPSPTIFSHPADDLTVCTTPPRSPTPPRPFPPVENNSGQRPEETWQAFFARRNANDLVRAQNESDQDKKRRIQREEHARKGCVPGRKGARVYFWEDVDGYFIRRAAGRGNYESYWEEYGSNQRRYDSFRDEWDLCTAFAPLDEPDIDDDGSDNDDYFQSGPLPPDPGTSHSSPPLPDIPSVLPDPQNIPDHREGAYSSTADLRRIYATQDSDDHPFHFDDHLDDLAYYRFGFVPPVGRVEAPQNLPQWHVVIKILGHGWIEGPAEPSRNVRDAMAPFFGYLLRAQSLTDVPSDMYDLRQAEAEVNQSWKIPVHREIFGDKSYYFISSTFTGSAADTQIELALTSAASVLEIVRRRWGPNVIDIMQQLLNRGIPFNSCIRNPTLASLPPTRPPRYNGLGYRPQGYKPDPVDYAAYESLRDQFLSSPRGRAAMLMGGIIARLARGVVPYGRVYDGPSDDVFEEGLCLRNGMQVLAYWDDQLTEDEINLICGVYKVDTGKIISVMCVKSSNLQFTGQRDGARGGQQTTDVSWWPKPSAWLVSALNVGYWSKDCESWFLKRLVAIKNGEADLKSPSQWKHSIKFTKTSLLAAQANDRLASSALHRF